MKFIPQAIIQISRKLLPDPKGKYVGVILKNNCANYEEGDYLIVDVEDRSIKGMPAGTEFLYEDNLGAMSIRVRVSVSEVLVFTGTEGSSLLPIYATDDSGVIGRVVKHLPCGKSLRKQYLK